MCNERVRSCPGVLGTDEVDASAAMLSVGGWIRNKQRASGKKARRVERDLLDLVKTRANLPGQTVNFCSVDDSIPEALCP